MARAICNQIRVNGNDLVHALQAAAAFTHADKKSHRHRLNLTTVTVDDHQVLLVSGGSPTRALAVNAGEAVGNDLSVDLSPAAAALIVKVFNGSGDVTLKDTGKILAVTAQDQLFDNQRIEVRTLPVDQRADSLRIVAIAINLATESEPYVAVSHDTAVAIAKAAKVIGNSPMLIPVGYHDSLGVRVTFGKAAIGYARASAALSALNYWDAATEESQPLADSPWYADHITLGHILDGVAPLKAPLSTVPDNDTEDEDEPDDGVDLDALDTTDALGEAAGDAA